MLFVNSHDNGKSFEDDREILVLLLIRVPLAVSSADSKE